jgi:hypothetical protein
MLILNGVRPWLQGHLKTRPWTIQPYTSQNRCEANLCLIAAGQEVVEMLICTRRR